MTTFRERVQAAVDAVSADPDGVSDAVVDAVCLDLGCRAVHHGALRLILAALDAEREAVHAWHPVGTAPEDTWIMTWDMVDDCGEVARALRRGRRRVMGKRETPMWHGEVM